MRRYAALLFLSVGATACARHDALGAAPSASSRDAETEHAGDAIAVVAPATTNSSTGAYSTPDAGVISSSEFAAEDAGALPQTRDKPEASGEAFDARLAALWNAIVADDPEQAMPFFFPVAAYEQVKAIANPARDWKLRLVAAYARDIHQLHAKLGKAAASARFVRFEAGPAPRWVEPGEEWNKIGYWRVFGSKMRFEREGGRADSFEIRSLISWRGAWYVVHLSAMK